MGDRLLAPRSGTGCGHPSVPRAGLSRQRQHEGKGCVNLPVPRTQATMGPLTAPAHRLICWAYVPQADHREASQEEALSGQSPGHREHWNLGAILWGGGVEQACRPFLQLRGPPPHVSAGGQIPERGPLAPGPAASGPQTGLDRAGPLRCPARAEFCHGRGVARPCETLNETTGVAGLGAFRRQREGGPSRPGGSGKPRGLAYLFLWRAPSPPR